MLLSRKLITFISRIANVALPTCQFFSSRNSERFLMSKEQVLVAIKHFHSSHVKLFKELQPTDKELATRDNFFREIKTKNRDTFLKATEKIFSPQDKIRRGHIEFIYSALKVMEDFEVEGDLEAYKKLMDVFPKGKMIPRSLIQAEFFHFAKDQECGIFLLDTVERTGCCPDKEMGEIIEACFGKSSHVYKKYARMLYWMPKLKNLNPYLLPDPLPMDGRALAKLALKKMSVDRQTKIEEFKMEEKDVISEGSWVMSAQSPDQQKLLREHPVERPLYVEGPFLVWMRMITMTYFVLCADPYALPPPPEDNDDVSGLPLRMFDEKLPLAVRGQSVHEQEDGVILGMCCTSDSSKHSLLCWIRGLRTANPCLDTLTVLFKLRTSPTTIAVKEEPAPSEH